MDDCFAVFDSLDSIKMFCDSLNEIHPNIKFITEIQNNKCINLMDVLVDNSSTTVTTSTFRKPTDTGLYSKLVQSRNGLTRKKYPKAETFTDGSFGPG